MKTPFKPLALIAFGTAAFAGPALAGDPEPFIPAPAAPVSVPMAPAAPISDWSGAYGGVQLGYGFGSATPATGGDIDGDGLVGGVHLGYNHDFGGYIAGIEADYDLSEIEFDNGAGDVDSIARLKLRAGPDLGTVFPYLTAGVAYADANIGGVDYSSDGYFGGLGVDYAVTDKVVLGGEALLHRFNDFDNTGVDVEATTVKAKVSYRF